MKPVLYNSKTHGTEFKEAMQNDTILLYGQLSALFADGIARASRHFGPSREPNKPVQPTRAYGPRG
jgi:hypothetical protein